MDRGLICEDCGSENADETICPYNEDINGTEVECVLCPSCYHERAMDI